MLTRYHIRLIIEECREMGSSGLDNGVNASIPPLEIDILKPPHDFLGVHGNPAVFVNKNTYKLLGALHGNWVMNKTIALKGSFLTQATVDVIGAIVHETGHAFNVAANIENTEANAYIYEIEVMRKLLETKSSLLFGCSSEDIQSFFKRRLLFYKQGTSNNEYLARLVESIKLQFQLEEDTPLASPSQQTSTKGATLFQNNGLSLFSHKQWNKENALILSKMTICM